MQCCGYKPKSGKANTSKENCASRSTDQQAPHGLRLSNNYMPLQAPPGPNFSHIAAGSSGGLYSYRTRLSFPNLPILSELGISNMEIICNKACSDFSQFSNTDLKQLLYSVPIITTLRKRGKEK